ncbi:MAG: TFIIB-type zinc ribbon-containing protein [Acetatifactor sp.]|nr:TFIIB-type zinc ribbon-containing protein [Acetatifactor sp.]
MIYRCPNCAAALTYDPSRGCLVCDRCDSAFRPEELIVTGTEDEPIVDMPSFQENSDDAHTEQMQCHIFTCTACGAEVIINDVETATFCIYCGQPTVVFSRVSQQLKPDYIIPFKIQKEAVALNIRYNLRKKFFIPKEIKNFQIDTLRGIYVPFWLYDIDYYDKQYFTVEMKILGGATRIHKGYFREAISKFEDLRIAASRVLEDEEIYSLEPFYSEEMMPFMPGYLSGFYADCFDLGKEQLWGKAVLRAQEYFDYDMRQALYKKGIESELLESKSPEVTLKKVSYALFPVWFLTFRYHGEAYTMFVNGQTGKLAGNLPVKKLRATILFALWTLILSIPFSGFSVICCLSMRDTVKHPLSHSIAFTIFSYLLFLIPGLLFGRYFSSRLKKGMRYTKSSKIHRFVKERQEV